MKKIFFVIILLAFALQSIQAQESRRERRSIREKEKAEEISKLIDQRNLRFVAQFAHPMAGGSIHLTSEYTLDISGDTVSAWLPFYGRAYSVEYGGRDGGIKFNEQAFSTEWKSEKKGTRAIMEVKAPRDVYRLNLQITAAGYATLDVSSNNRQSIRFSGIVTKLPEPEGK
jgi:hypothetical protein